MVLHCHCEPSGRGNPPVIASDRRERGNPPVIASDRRERGNPPVIASDRRERGNLILSYKIATSLPATLRSRLRLTLAMTLSDCRIASLLATTPPGCAARSEQNEESSLPLNDILFNAFILDFYRAYKLFDPLDSFFLAVALQFLDDAERCFGVDEIRCPHTNRSGSGD
jgi:hypothetical protein